MVFRNIDIKFSKKNSKLNSSIYKTIIHHNQVSFIIAIQDWINIWILSNVSHLINSLKKKKHMIISMHAGEAFDKIQHPFQIKIPIKVGIERNFFNLLKGIYKLPRAKIILLGKRLTAVPKFRNTIRTLTLTTFIEPLHWKTKPGQ